VFQQVTRKAARTIHDRVCALTPGAHFPSPAELLAIPEARLLKAGLSRAKLAALRDLAARIEDRRLVLAGLARREDEEIIELLSSVRGIGRWTAQMFLLLRLGRLDVMAEGDLGVREGIRLLDGKRARPTPGEALERGEVWRPLRSVGCWAMWRLVETERLQGGKARAQEKRRGGNGSRGATRNCAGGQ